ncbi:MAG: efflux RND transporter periplasmic adaptor subunit [Planctomycetes bacterium]|nr:efflux RND transporter periplasmic adaptor subunit [Planctomycetota bacterium]
MKARVMLYLKRNARATLKWALLPAAIFALFLFFEGAFGGGMIYPGFASMREESITGKFVPVIVRKFPKYVDLTGVVESRRQAEITSQVMAQVVEIRKRPGAEVSKDEAIVVLDSRTFEARKSQAESGARAIEKNLAQLELDLARFERLSARGAATAREVELLRTSEGALKDSLAAANQIIAEARAFESYCTIRAPFDGVLGDVFIEQGDVATPARSLCVVYAKDELILRAYLPASVSRSSTRTPMVIVPTANVRSESANFEIAKSADYAAQSFTIRAEIPAGSLALPGLSGTVRWYYEDEEVLLVPLSNVSRVGQLETVIVQGESRAGRRAVRTGRRFSDEGQDDRGGLVEILSGLAREDLVLTNE